MSKKKLLTLVALIIFLCTLMLVVVKMRNIERGAANVPTTNVQKAVAPQPLKAPAVSDGTRDVLRQLFVEAEELVNDVEERRIEALSGDQRMGYGAAVDAAEDALTKLEAYRDSMQTEQLEKLKELRLRLDE